MSSVQPNRGEVWWVELDPVVGHEQAGRRPVIVVSSNDFLETGAERAAIVPLSTKYHMYPSCVPVNQNAEIKRPSWALTDQIRTIDFTRFKKFAGRADLVTMHKIEEALRLLLNL